MKIYKIKEKGKEVLVKTTYKDAEQLERMIEYVRKQYTRRWKDADYKVEPYSLKEAMYRLGDQIQIVEIEDTDIEV